MYKYILQTIYTMIKSVIKICGVDLLRPLVRAAFTVHFCIIFAQKRQGRAGVSFFDQNVLYAFTE